MHPLLIFAIIVVCVALAANIVSNISSRRKRLEMLKHSFGKPPEDDEYIQFKSIGRYAQFMQTHSTTKQIVDTTTWNDLEMDKVFNRINSCQTSIGEEYLFHNLQQLPLNDKALKSREELIKFFENNPETRLKIQFLLARRVGKENYNGLTSLMFAPSINMLKHRHIYTVLAFVPLLFIALMPINLPIGVIGLVGAFVINMFVHYGTKSRIATLIPSIKYLTGVLYCCKSLAKIKEMQGLPIMTEIHALHKKLKSLQRKVPRAASTASGDLADSLFEYVNIMFLSDIRNYNKFVGTVKARSEAFHALYRAIGELDISICILSFRLSLPVYSLPEFISDGVGELTDGHKAPIDHKIPIVFEDIFHPLITDPVTNTGIIQNDCLLTGSNASGKSTFIKALAINGILAQTINTAAAKAFRARFSLILTSMVVRDDLSAGDSYFIVEIKSLKRVLDMVENFPCTCYIDEILRGTNTIERIAASASVLSHLHMQNALCIAASHDIELTKILDGKFDNFHFREHVTEDGIVFDYKLNHGPSTTRNAIKLLRVMGFSEEIVGDAERLCEGY